MLFRSELTLFTHAAMNGLYGESFIVYNPAYQELKIHESYTRQKDGKIVKTPENAFVEVLPAAAASHFTALPVGNPTFRQSCSFCCYTTILLLNFQAPIFRNYFSRLLVAHKINNNTLFPL